MTKNNENNVCLKQTWNLPKDGRFLVFGVLEKCTNN